MGHHCHTNNIYVHFSASGTGTGILVPDTGAERSDIGIRNNRFLARSSTVLYKQASNGLLSGNANTIFG